MRATVLPAVMGSVLSLPVSAVNWNFLEFSPASSFTEQDFELLKQAGREALDAAADGDTRGWSNPETGAFGTIQPLSTYEHQGTTCRRVEIFNNSSRASGTSRFDFCRHEDGTWKIAPSPRPPAR